MARSTPTWVRRGRLDECYVIKYWPLKEFLHRRKHFLSPTPQSTNTDRYLNCVVIVWRWLKGLEIVFCIEGAPRNHPLSGTALLN